jgi:hypothetical protein
MPARLRTAIPFALLLLCLAAIIFGILLSGSEFTLFGAPRERTADLNPATIVLGASDGGGRGIILGDTLSERSLPPSA